MRPYVDLHLHSCHSDGTDPPATVVERAAGLGVSAIALTDHDTVAGVASAEMDARSREVGFLRGTEISAQFERAEIHVVGLGVRIDSAPLLEALKRLRAGRDLRGEQMVERLNAAGIPIDAGKVAARAGEDASLGRMHVAQEIAAAGHTKTVQEAFDRYLKPGRPAYVPKERMACGDAIDTIHEAGGLAFVAHPGIGMTRKLLARLLVLPFDGIEAYHSKHTPGHVTQFTQLAGEQGLLIAGGSDCHGAAKSNPEMGKVRVPYECYERIVDALAAQA